MKQLLIYFICLIILPNVLHGQIEGHYSQRTLGGLCSCTYDIFSDSLYTQENGCEGSSYFSIGKWKTFKDTILFTPLSANNFDLINNVNRDIDSMKTIRVSIIDQNGVNITKKIRIVQIGTQGKQYSMSLDSNGTTRFDYQRNNGELLISQFYKPFGDNVKINILGSNRIIITLNITERMLQNQKSKWREQGESKVIITNGGFRVDMPESFYNTESDKSHLMWVKE